jgi:hypothetical protein
MRKCGVLAVFLAQVLNTPTCISRTGRPGLDRQRGPLARDAARTTLRLGPPFPSASDTGVQNPARPCRSRCCPGCPESSTTCRHWRWPWTSCGPRGEPSCQCPPAARSPPPRSAPGSPGSWHTPGPRCTGRSPPCRPCWLRSPGPNQPPGLSQGTVPMPQETTGMQTHRALGDGPETPRRGAAPPQFSTKLSSTPGPWIPASRKPPEPEGILGKTCSALDEEGFHSSETFHLWIVHVLFAL